MDKELFKKLFVNEAKGALLRGGGGGGSSATVTTEGEGWVSTVVPSEGYIEKVYVNTALSNEEVTEILSQLTYYPMNSYHGFDGDILFINNNRVGLFVERQYTGTIRLYGHCQSTNDDIYGLLWSNTDGWEQTFVNEHNSTLVINDTVSASNITEALNWTNYYEYTASVGTQNELLAELFSITPFTKEEKTFKFAGNYDGSTVTMTENGVVDIKALLDEKKLPLTVTVDVKGGANVTTVGGWEGTAVPREGKVEKVYINNNLSVEEVVSLVRDVCLNKIIEEGYVDITTSSDDYDDNIYINAGLNDDNTIRYLSIKVPDYDGDLFYYDMDYPEDSSGWASDGSDFSYSPANVLISELSDGYAIGELNDQLSQLFSTTPFVMIPGEPVLLSGAYDGSGVEVTENGTVDIETMLSENKLPLAIKINVNPPRVASMQGYIDSVAPDLSYKFQDFSNMTDATVLLEGVDTSGITTMNGVFYSCGSLTTVPLFDTSNVTEMSDMFTYCRSLTELPLFDTSNVQNMSAMFCRCEKLTNLPLLDTSNVTDMGTMFGECKSLTNVPSFDTGNVKDMSSMFYSCTSLETVPLFDTSNVTNMFGMFRYCSSLKTVPEFDCKNVTDMGSMFQGCNNLTEIRIKNIKSVLQLNDNTSLTQESLIHIIKELWDHSITGLTGYGVMMGSTNLAKLDGVYVKLVTPTAEQLAEDPELPNKKPCEVCASTDEGAMSIVEYATLKNRNLS